MKLIKTLIAISLTALVFISSSCTTLTVAPMDSDEKKDRMYTVYIDSKTQGLPVYYTKNGEEHLVGYTPVKYYSNRAQTKYLTVKKDDISETISLDRKARKSSYWNFFPIPAYNWIWGYFYDKNKNPTYGQKEYYVDL